MQTLIIDHIDKIEIDPSNPALQGNHAFEYLPYGLNLLANTIRAEEIDLLRARDNTPSMFISFKDYHLFACYFNWFSVSIINYARLVALMDLMTKNNYTKRDLTKKENHSTIKKYCREYVKRILPDIYVWRNKISAHFAITDPFKNDNLGTLEASIIIPVSYVKPYYVASAWQPAMAPPSKIPSWKLTKVYEGLLVRFFPNFKFKKLPDYS